jgi:NADPH:quinone reductase-like Zn-dependent oxidoreductase
VREGIVKLRYKILNSIAAVLAVGIVALCVALSHESPCPPVASFTAPGESMRAVMKRCYGEPGVLRVERIAKPEPGEGRVLIRVHAAAVNPAEWHATTGRPYIMRLGVGMGAPADARVGLDMAGTVVATGPGVTRFKPGDEVFGGVGGALSEFVVAREAGALVAKPASMTFEEAAGIPIAAVTALQGLRDQGRLKSGQTVLINGASGGVGTYAVQIAKAMGAEVTAVCSTRNVELVRSLGADHVVDYTREDFTTLGARYDVILDNVGNHSYFDLERVTDPDGIIVTIGGPKTGRWLGPLGRVLWSKIVGHFIDPQLRFFIASVNRADLEYLAGLANDGRLRTVIDRHYPLEQTGEALAYIGGGRARGKVIIDLD